MSETLILQQNGPVTTITVNRPEVGNAFSADMYGKLAAIMRRLDTDEDTRAIVITGAGKHFSAGGDIAQFKQMIEEKSYITEAGVQAAGDMARAIRQCGKPVIAMINGAAAGAGASLALACDFRVMEPSSKIVMSFINMALCGDTSGVLMLNAYVGLARTTEWMALATPLSGEECLGHGLANRLAPQGGLLDETMKFAATLAAIPTKTFACQKKMYLDGILANQQAFTDLEAKYMRETSMSNDHREAVFAFLEKRKPEFKGN